MSKEGTMPKRERLRVFLFLLPPAIVSCVAVAALLLASLPTVAAAALGILPGCALAYAISGYLLDNIAGTNAELKLQLQENLTEAASEKNKLETILKHISDGILAMRSD
ncbi:MAG: hypothetical protein LBD12_02715, partial [Clostridiales Family XIII bacterium]|nr:hypothetical protein [Clostridiales Family XIII bacterium]